MARAHEAGRPGRRVLVVSHEASRTGAPRVAVALVRALRGAGHHVTVAHRWGGPLEQELDAAATTSRAVPGARLRAALRRARRPRAADAVGRWGARRTIGATAPELVWCNTVVSLDLAEAAVAAGVPTIVYGHEQADWLAPAAPRLRALAQRGATFVGCCTDSAAVLADAAGVPTEDVAVLASPVDVEWLGSTTALDDSGGGPLIVGCGRANATKGFDAFVAAATMARDADLDWRFRWVGAADDDARRQADGVVDVVGEVADPARHLASADVFVLPSRFESFPLVVLEAMALARPVVASDLSGTREQLGEAGVFVPPADAAALVEACRALLDEPAHAKQLGEAGRRRCAELWDVRPFAREAARITAQVLDRPAADRAGHAPVRVAHVMGRLSHGGGVQMVVRRLAAATDPSRVELHVISTRPAIEADAVHELPLAFHPLGYTPLGFRPTDRVRLAVAVARAVRRTRPDVVQLHSGLAWLGLAARAIAPRARFVLEVHDAPGSGRHGPVTDKVEGWWVRWLGTTAVCHSTSVEHEVRVRWRPRPDRVVTFPLAVDVDTFQPLTEDERRAGRALWGIPDDVVLLVAVGRFAPSKRFGDLVAVVAEARARGVDLGVLLVGDGPERPQVEAAVAERGVADRVWLAGPNQNHEIPAIIGFADVLASPSVYEGFGLTLIEGMACGLPAVARAVGGVTDIVQPDATGLLVEGAEIGPFVDAVLELATDPPRRHRMGAAARRVAEERYSAVALAGSFTDLYERLARRG